MIVLDKWKLISFPTGTIVAVIFHPIVTGIYINSVNFTIQRGCNLKEKYIETIANLIYIEVFGNLNQICNE